MTPLRPGTVFANTYEIVRPISAGGMGFVYEVVHRGTRRHRALKVMLAHIMTDPKMRERFTLEAVVGADVESEHVTEVFDAGIDPETDCPYLVMELLKGEDLGARLKRGERYSADETLLLLGQVVRALAKTHERGIIHRDLKPDNIFITRRDDGEPRIKILDFGIAKVIQKDANGPQATTHTFGTPYYMAREQITGESALIGPTSDLYAVAHIAFAMLTGTPYFQDEARENAGNVLAVLLAAGKGATEPATARARRRGVELPPAFDAWFAKATNVSPAMRFATGQELIAALREVLRDPVQVLAPMEITGKSGSGGSGSGSVSGVSAPESSSPSLDDTSAPQSITHQVARPAKKRTAMWLVGGAVALGVGVGVVGFRFLGSAHPGDGASHPEAQAASADRAGEPEKKGAPSLGAATTVEPAAASSAPAGTAAPPASEAPVASAEPIASTTAKGAPGTKPAGGAQKPPGGKPSGTATQGGEVWETR
jgi:serine/threonine-protein kinase